MTSCLEKKTNHWILPFKPLRYLRQNLIQSFWVFLKNNLEGLKLCVLKHRNTDFSYMFKVAMSTAGWMESRIDIRVFPVELAQLESM